MIFSEKTRRNSLKTLIKQFYSKLVLMKKSSFFKTILLILIIIIGLNLKNILVSFTGTDVPIAVVRGSSMYPLLREGDIVFSYKPKPDQIKEGDIIIYESIVHNRLIIHRVVEVRIINNNYYYQTKGDNNFDRDYREFTGPGRAGIPYDRVKGVVISIDKTIFKIPYLGYLSIWRDYLISLFKKDLQLHLLNIIKYI